MGKRFYVVTRDLHLYAGLFLSPFLVVFALSVFVLVHAPRANPETPVATRVATNLGDLTFVEQFNGPELVARLRPVLKQMGVEGEVNFIRRVPKEHRLIVPVMLPGRDTTVDMDVPGRTAKITERTTGLADAMVHLHKMPGPHNAALRGNSLYMWLWRWVTDFATYGIFFLTLSGIYLWAVLRAERRVGLALLLAGGLSFLGLVYALAS